MEDGSGIYVAARISMRARRGSDIPSCVIGPVLFPMTIGDVGAARASGSNAPSREDLNDEFLARPSPRLPRHGGIQARAVFGATSLLLHVALLTALLALAGAQRDRTPDARSSQVSQTHLETPRLVHLIERVRPGPGGGGGGGGNRQQKPIPRVQAPGRDAATVPAASPAVPATPQLDALPPLQAIALDAKRLASGLAFQIGSLDGVLASGTSQGPGSGGGVGDGVGTGIGSGRGAGLGPGSGGGTGGGVYRPGGGITAPTLVREVKPTYTPDALRAKIQGSVFLDVIVQRDGIPRDIIVVRSLDRGGLDRQAVLAVEQWRFNPGRLNGVPVDVLISVIVDFRIY